MDQQKNRTYGQPQQTEENNIFIKLIKRRERKRKALLITLTSLISAALLGVGGYYAVYYGYVVHEVDYQIAEKLFDDGKYQEAAEAFTELGSFKDSEMMVTECKYQEAMTQYDDGDYIHAQENFTKLENYKESQSMLKKISAEHPQMIEVQKYGFGRYGGQDLKWKILATTHDRMLIITEEIIEAGQYHNDSTDVTWETSYSRDWLNSTFLLETFDASERKEIAYTMNTNSGNEKYGTVGCGETRDKLFYLSIDEANTYFSSNADRVAKATDQATLDGLFYSSGNTANWWLRSPGATQTFAAAVTSLGKVSESGFGAVNLFSAGVRPALWMKI